MNNDLMLKKTTNNFIPNEIIDALITLHDNGKFKEILSRFPNLIKLYPNNSKLLNIMGVILSKNDSKLEAIEAFKKAIKFDTKKSTTL